MGAGIAGSAAGSFKASKTLLGIETAPSYQVPETLHSFKASKTLLGIETQAMQYLDRCALLLVLQSL